MVPGDANGPWAVEVRDMAGSDAHTYEPSEGHRLRHDPFNAIVGPRPIGWISTLSEAGHANLAPYSFFNAFNYRPPIVGFSSIGWKDTLANADRTREFGWSLATRPLAEAMNATSATTDLDEFHLAGVAKRESLKIAPPCVLESPVNFECRVTQIIRLEGADGVAADTWLVLGEVVVVHIDPAYLADGVYETAKAHPILRAGRLGDYAEITPEAMFSMARPA